MRKINYQGLIKETMQQQISGAKGADLLQAVIKNAFVAEYGAKIDLRSADSAAGILYRFSLLEEEKNFDALLSNKQDEQGEIEPLERLEQAAQFLEGLMRDPAAPIVAAITKYDSETRKHRLEQCKMATKYILIILGLLAAAVGVVAFFDPLNIVTDKKIETFTYALMAIALVAAGIVATCIGSCMRPELKPLGIDPTEDLLALQQLLNQDTKATTTGIVVDLESNLLTSEQQAAAARHDSGVELTTLGATE